MNLRLELHFTDGSEMTLQRTVLEGSSLPKRLVSVRGKTAWSRSATGSFEWSSAVRAMSILLVESLLTPGYLLRSEFATTLDYALSKKPLWLREMFGISGAVNVCNRLFKRVYTDNSKHVAIKISDEYTSRVSLTIFLNGLPVENSKQLSHLRNSILAGTPPSNPRSIRKLLELSLIDELRYGLSRPDIITQQGQYGIAQYLSRLQTTERLDGYRVSSFLAEYRAPGQISLSRLDLVEQLKQSSIHSIELPALIPSAAALFCRIKDWGVPLELRFSHAASYTFVRNLLNGSINKPPHVVTIGAVPLMHLMNSALCREYVIVMPICAQSGWAVTGLGTDTNRISYFTEEPSNMMLIDERVSAATKRINATTAEILGAIHQHSLESGAILLPPFGFLARQMGASTHRVCGDGSSALPHFLLLRRDVATPAAVKRIEEAVVRAWSEILLDTQSAPRAIKTLLSYDDFCHQLMVEGGLYQLAA